jgi:peptidoglycan/LPS O-acetylase OafA/YrhL
MAAALGGGHSPLGDVMIESHGKTPGEIAAERKLPKGVLGLRPESTAFLRLDFIRFVASIGIVVFHYAAWLGLGDIYVGGLQLFVDVFFAISGLVITYVYIEKVNTLAKVGRFMAARLARLVPLHWLLTLIYVALSLVAGVSGLQLTQPDKYDTSCLPGVFTLTHAFGGCDKLVYNFVSWSVSAEFAMYLIFPIIVVCLARSKKASLTAFLIVLVGLYIFDWGWWERTYDFGALRALPGFLLGMTLFLWRDELQRLAISGKLFLPVLLMLLAAMLFIPKQGQGIVVLLAYMSVVLFYAMDRRGAPGPLMIRLSALGQLTYSLYMIHPLVQTLVLNVIGSKILHLQGGTALIFAYATVLFLVALSYLSLVWFETPARKWVRSALTFQTRAKA